jgi:hypothetical protein
MSSNGLTDVILALLHAVATVVVVEDGATIARYSPLHHHTNCHLRSRHTAVCWRGLHPLPLTSRLTGRWSPRTSTPLHGVVEGGHVSSTVGVARPKGPHHRVVRGRRREEKKKMMSAASRWSPAPLEHRRFIGWRTSSLAHRADPKDHWHHRPSCNTLCYGSPNLFLIIVISG